MKPRGKFYQTDEFSKLDAEWTKKLQESGFEDIEQKDERLNRWDSHFFKVHHDPVLSSAKTEYYRLAGQFYHDFHFSSEVDRKIWELHSQGTSIRTIARALKATTTPLARNSIHNIILRLQKLMRLYANTR